jgi:phage N-6-adenine-methyltransferase
MSLSPGVFSSARTVWETPPELFALLHREFRFTLDVCATRTNRKCPVYFTPRENALRQPWTGTCWMNPPYGRAIGRWVRKAHQESRSSSAKVVCLLPARTDTAWWHDHVMQAREIRLLRGRLVFVGARSSAPFPSAIVIFETKHQPTAPFVIGWNWRAIASVAARSAA